MNDTATLQACQAALAAAFGEGAFESAQTLIRDGHELSARQRLDIYRNGIRETQGEALEAIYPAVARLLGTEFFAHMAILYAERHPSVCGDLRRFGSALPAFLQRFDPVAHLTYLSDVARLEWACHESFHAAAAETPTAPPANSGRRLRLAPHVRLLRSAFPIAEIWEFALSEHRPDQPLLDVERDAHSHALITRPGMEVQVMTLPPEDWSWLLSLDGCAEASDNSAASMPDAQTLHVYHRLGVLCHGPTP